MAMNEAQRSAYTKGCYYAFGYVDGSKFKNTVDAPEFAYWFAQGLDESGKNIHGDVFTAFIHFNNYTKEERTQKGNEARNHFFPKQ